MNNTNTEHINTTNYSHTDIRNIIVCLEGKYPVEKWNVNGVYIWPHIRIKLFIVLLNSDKPLVINDRATSRDVASKVKFTLSLKWLQSLWQLTLLFFKLREKPLLFFGSHFHRVKYKEYYFNKYFDAMIETHSLQEQSYIVEFQKALNPIYNSKIVLNLNSYLPLLKKLEKLINNNNTITRFLLEDYNEFYEELAQFNINRDQLKLDQNSLSKWTLKVNRTVKIFDYLFKKIKPQKIIFLSYYGFDDIAAAMISANTLGIKTIDMQHGPQTNVHMAYSKWTKIPTQGYNTMPKEYWVWDDISKNNINEWAKDHSDLNVKVVGNPYINFFASSSKFSSENKILYSLQTFNDIENQFFTPAILKLMRSNTYYWVLRMHPRSTFNATYLREFLKSKSIDETTFEIQDSYQKPLPEELLKVKLHITNFSGCLLEARSLMVPTLVIDQTGFEMFETYLDHKLVYFNDKHSKLFETNFIALFNHLKHNTLVQHSIIYNPLN